MNPPIVQNDWLDREPPVLRVSEVSAVIKETLEGAFPADLALQSTNFNSGVSDTALSALATLDEVEVVSALNAGPAEVKGQSIMAVAVDPDTIDAVYSSGASIPMDELFDGVLVRNETLDSNGWTIGDRIDITYPSSETVSTVIAGTFDDQAFSAYLISTDTYEAHYPETPAFMAFVDLADGVELETGLKAVEEAVAAFPSINVNTRSDQIEQAEAQIDQMLGLFSALLGLAVIIAVIGIANTLAMSVVERTREIGLLRAVGMDRRTVRRMVRWESVITALFGAILGIGVGVLLGWATVASLADQGLGDLALPGGQLVAWIVLAALAGIIAAVGPALKAGRRRILDAIAYE